MKFFLFILIIVLLVTGQVVFVPFFSFKGIGPDLALVFVLLWTVSKGFKKIWPGLILIGLILDFLSGLAFGLISLGLVGSAYLVDWLNRTVFPQVNFRTLVILVAAAALFNNLFLIYAGRLFQSDLTFNLECLLIGILYNLLIMTVFFYGFKKIFS